MNQAASIKSSRFGKSDKPPKTAVAWTPISEELDFEDFITNASKVFDCPVPIFVFKEYQREYIPKMLKIRQANEYKSKRLNIVYSPITSCTTTDETVTLFASSESVPADNTLTIVAGYDAMQFLTELSISKFICQPIPRTVMQLIHLVIGEYKELNKFTIKDCRIDPYTIYELSKIISVSAITDICLDGCPLPEGNYDTLLNRKSCLKHLSLCRCKINDDVCELISTKLCYTEPAEEHLIALNLTSNDITDVGAKYLADALRTNRTLRYLNLGNNHLSDEGASVILDKLTEFPLTAEEIMDKRYRYMFYLKKKLTLYYECLQKFGTMSPVRKSGISNPKTPSIISKTPLKKGNSKKSSAPTSPSQLNKIPNTIKAEIMAAELLGPFQDPFNEFNVKISKHHQYCVGNFALCYLNIAYNDLTYRSVKKLLSVVEYQQSQKGPDMCGLINVVLDGNYIPGNCVELSTINNILEKQISACLNIRSLGDRRKSSTKPRDSTRIIDII